MPLKSFFFCLFSFVLLTCAQEPPRFTEMTKQQIDQLLRDVAEKDMTITERMDFYSKYFLGMPYSWTCTGDGPYALYETYPLVSFDSTNCMVYCEHVLALSISDSWDNFFNNLQQIRYRDGMIGMRTRNHYTMADWLPENSWLLDDVTKNVGGTLTQKVTRIISHQAFFKKKGITDLRYVLPDREITIDFIPKEDLLKIKNQLREGDIGVLIFASKNDIFAAHMWMVFRDQERWVVREASTTGMTTFDTAYDQWVAKIQKSKRYTGISLMRVKEQLNRPGKIILPWEINGMKPE